MQLQRIICLIFSVFTCLAAYADSDIERAETIVRAWLQAVDEGEVREAWRSSSELLRQAVGPEELASAIEAARRGFGSVIERARVSAQRKTSLPGAPDGEYIILTFHTRFENKQRGVETLSLRLEEGVWKVSGYFVR